MPCALYRKAVELRAHRLQAGLEIARRALERPRLLGPAVAREPLRGGADRLRVGDTRGERGVEPLHRGGDLGGVRARLARFVARGGDAAAQGRSAALQLA